MPKPPKEFIRYHYQVGFPDYIGEMCTEFFSNFTEVNTTLHCANQLMDDTNGSIPFPSFNDIFNPENTLVEVYEKVGISGRPTGLAQKVVIRVHHLDDKKDYSYVCARDGFLVSAWANSKTDIHRLKYKHIYFSDFRK